MVVCNFIKNELDLLSLGKEEKTPQTIGEMAELIDKYR